MMKAIFGVLVLAALVLPAASVSARGPGQVLLAHEETGMHGHMHHDWDAPKKAALRKNPVPADRASLERGKKLFETNCAVCHGKTGLGDGPGGAALNPKPANLRVMSGEHSAGDLAWKIANGRGPMPAWKGTLNKKQIWDLVNYLKSMHTAGD